jgi:hypothetical protein
MGLLDVVKQMLGGADQDIQQPSVAEITIISTDGVSSSSESQSEPVQG